MGFDTETLEECQAKAVGLRAKALEFGAEDHTCMTHMSVATGGNNYPGVTCYDVVIEDGEAVGDSSEEWGKRDTFKRLNSDSGEAVGDSSEEPEWEKHSVKWENSDSGEATLMV